MVILAIIGALVMFGIMFWAMNREPKISGFYSQLRICGRWGAFFAIYLMLVAVVAVVMSVVLLFSEASADAGTVVGIVGAGAVCFLLGFFLYRRIHKKCPESLRKRLLWDMIVVCFGVLFRISFFVMAFVFETWWLYTAPTVYEVDGKTVYRYPGSKELYDEYGFHAGKLDNSGIVTTANMD